MTVLTDPLLLASSIGPSRLMSTQQATAVMAAAGRLLTRRTGVEVTLTEAGDLGGTGETLVVRARVGENPFSLPRTLVVKQAPQLDGVEMFTREVVSYQFTTSLAAADRPGPELFAWDLGERVLIISDLGEGTPMSQLLAPPAGGRGIATPSCGEEHALMAWAQRLGRMHAATAGREPDFAALLRRAKVPSTRGAIGQQVVGAASALPEQLREQLGVAVSGDVLQLVAEAGGLFEKGEFRAFSPADPGPDNILMTDQGVRFLDYEWGGFRDAMLDIAYALVTYRGFLREQEALRNQDAQGPWTELDRRMVHAWRAEVAAVWPALADDATLWRKILQAELVWVWLTTAWWLPGHSVDGAWAHGHALSAPTPAALLARWEGLRGVAETAGDRSVAEHARTVADALRAAWRW